jgi:hypothetical protein
LGKDPAGVNRPTTTHNIRGSAGLSTAPATTTRTKQENGDNQMENLDVLKQFDITSLEEARELAELTNRIVADLKTIEENELSFDDFQELERQTGIITGNLQVINNDDNDLDELVEQTNYITGNLKVIGEEA